MSSTGAFSEKAPVFLGEELLGGNGRLWKLGTGSVVWDWSKIAHFAARFLAHSGRPSRVVIFWDNDEKSLKIQIP